MTIGIHPVHRRLAELNAKARQSGGWDKAPKKERKELYKCLNENEKLIHKHDNLRELSFQAYLIGDVDWQHKICKKIEKLEASMEVF